MQIQPDPPDRILRIKAVLALTGLTRSTLYRKMEAGTFPKNTRISTRCMGWRESAVSEWLRSPTPDGPGNGSTMTKPSALRRDPA